MSGIVTHAAQGVIGAAGLASLAVIGAGVRQARRLRGTRTHARETLASLRARGPVRAPAGLPGPGLPIVPPAVSGAPGGPRGRVRIVA